MRAAAPPGRSPALQRLRPPHPGRHRGRGLGQGARLSSRGSDRPPRDAADIRPRRRLATPARVSRRRREVFDDRLWMAIAAATGAGGNTSALVGTAEQVADSLLRYYDAGVTSILIRGFEPLQDVVEYGRSSSPWCAPPSPAASPGRRRDRGPALRPPAPPMTDEPAVSVIVLGYNGRDYVDACLTSVLDQDFGRPYEVLFVDNGSRDGSADSPERHAGVQRPPPRPQLRLHRRQQPRRRRWPGRRCSSSSTRTRRPPRLAARAGRRGRERRQRSRPATPTSSTPGTRSTPRRSASRPSAPPTRGELSPLGFVEYNAVPVDQRGRRYALPQRRLDHPQARPSLAEIGGYIFDPDMFLYGEDMDLGLRIRSAGYRTVVATRAVVYHDHTPAGPHLRGDRFSRRCGSSATACWRCGSPPTGSSSCPWRRHARRARPSIRRSSACRCRSKSALLLPPVAADASSQSWRPSLAMPRYAAAPATVLRPAAPRRGWLLRALLFDRASVWTRPSPCASASVR